MFLHRNGDLIVEARITKEGIKIDEYLEDSVVGYDKFVTFLAYLFTRRDINLDMIPRSVLDEVFLHYRKGSITRSATMNLLRQYSEVIL